jgi:DNA-binding response OmpR family regulator
MSKHILVIDDDIAIRESFLLALKDTGYTVDVVESGEKGIEKERTKKYDLIFLDLKMPGISGIETLREIRKVNKNTPIYIITAFYKDFFDELKAAEKENLSYDIIKKPINGEQILLITKSILEGPFVT